MYSGVEVNTRHLLCQRTGTTGTAREGMRPAVHAHAPPAARPCAHRSCGCCAHAGPAQSGYRSAGSLRAGVHEGRCAAASTERTCFTAEPGQGCRSCGRAPKAQMWARAALW